MGRGIDVALRRLPSGAYDPVIGFDGDFDTRDFFDTAIVVSLFVDARADESDVAEPERRRGWIGNEHTPGFQIGSTLWVYSQSRLTRSVLSKVEDAARQALQWLVDDGHAVAISSVTASASDQPGRATLGVVIERSPSETVRRFFDLWQNTGRGS